MEPRNTALEALLGLWRAGIGEGHLAELLGRSAVFVRLRDGHRSQENDQYVRNERSTHHRSLWF
jgi:hypothetical protein